MNLKIRILLTTRWYGLLRWWSSGGFRAVRALVDSEVFVVGSAGFVGSEFSAAVFASRHGYCSNTVRNGLSVNNSSVVDLLSTQSLLQNPKDDDVGPK